MRGTSIFFAFLVALLPLGASSATPLQDFEARIAAAKTAMMTNPKAALNQSVLAERLANGLPSDPAGDTARATAGWLKGEALARLNRPNDAAPITSAALNLAERAAPHTKLVADLYRSQGNLLASLGKIEAAFHNLRLAHDTYRAIGERRGEAMSLQNIGSLYSDAGDNERVLYYYAQSAEVFPGDPQLMMVASNNRAEAFKKLGRYRDAWPQYRAALAQARTLGSSSLQARILTNLADAQVSSGNPVAAEATVAHGLALATGDAAEWRPFLFGVKARIDYQRGNLRSAARWIGQTFNGMDLRTTPVPYRDAHGTAYRIYSDMHDFPKAFAHLAAFKRLDDETRALTASTVAALVAANFDFANQDLRIAQLKAGQIARDATIAEAKAHLNTIILAGTLAVGGVVLILLSFGFVSIRRSRDEVRAANDQLSKTNAVLEMALTAKTQFLATTSHEIRTPLNGILGMTEVILSGRGLDAALRDQLQVVHGAGKTMRALVDDILDVAKMEHGELTIVPSQFALPDLVRDVARLWESQAAAKGVDVAIDLSECPALIIEDEARLRQIVFNLMSNAVKFTDEGRVCLRVSVVSGAAPQLCVTVRDSGVGIPADKIAQIFESFRQVDSGTTRRFGGTGLGLAICRNLARAMGGDVTVSSTEGAGSVFELVLPFRQPASAEPTLEKLRDPLLPRSLAEATLLIVERNPLTRSILGAVLEPRVGEIVFASDEEEAKRAATPTIDHVVIDLATLTNLHVIEDLRVAMPDASFVLLRPASLPDERLEPVKGIDHMLTKPVAPHALLSALEQVQGKQQNSHLFATDGHRNAA